ncbi:MAG TPA: universal stress protein [Gaiellaceae bacterium]|jgi:nucleotide-binding universal stress UspA family protein|nr:universal stress protein [Gaiellaceae bacterium]
MAKIVVGIDGSDHSKAALRWAVEEGRLRNADVAALHAYEVPLRSPDISPASRPDLIDTVTEAYEGALAFVTRIVEEVVAGDSTVNVETFAVEGTSPESVLIEASRDAELLVVGSRGRSELAELLLGSVSQECAHHAACPVLIHRRPGA